MCDLRPVSVSMTYGESKSIGILKIFLFCGILSIFVVILMCASCKQDPLWEGREGDCCHKRPC